MKGVGKSRDTENVVTAQSSEMNSPFFHTYDTLHVLLKILDGEIKYKSSVHCEWVIILLNELGVRGCACASRSEFTVCMKKGCCTEETRRNS